MRDLYRKSDEKQKKYSIILYVIWAAFSAFCLTAPLFVGRYYTGFILLIFLYCINAVGFNIASGFCGLMTFATGSIYAMGAYTAAILHTLLDVPFVIAALCGALAGGLLSLVITVSAYKANGIFLTLVSFGLIEVVTQIMMQAKITGGAQGYRVAKWVFFGTTVNATTKYYITFAVLVLAFIIQMNIKNSQWGRDFISIKDDFVAAAGVGLNNHKHRLIGFFISCTISGFAGAFFATYAGYISPETFGFGFSIMILLMVLTGGEGTLSGPIVGAILITVVPEIFNANPEMKIIFYGALLIVITQIMPRGVAGVLRDKFHEIENNRHIKHMDLDKEIDFTKYVSKRNNTNKDVLVVKGLSRQFGGLAAVNNLDMTVERGTIHALIGPNGAGKSTAVNNITGLDKPTSGEVWFNGELINGQKAYRLVEKGMARTYQHVRLFKSLSVIDNVASGARIDKRYNVFDALLQTPKKRRLDREIYTEAQECLNLLGIGDKSNEMPDSLSAGQQKLMEIGRALIAKPELLLLDEPCAGLTESETAQFAGMMKKIRSTGISILLIEHHMSLVMDVSDIITVIDHGEKIAEGKPEEISKNPAVLAAYLGG